MRLQADLPAERWDALLLSLPGSSPYHSSEWARTVQAGFGGTFRVLTVEAEATYFVPVLVGGKLAGEGFCCGHVGYGGVFHRTLGAELPISVQARVLCFVERELGLRCARLVTAPRGDLPAHGDEIATSILALPDSAEQLWSSYDAKTRNMIRKAERSGLTASPLAGDRFDECLSLIQATQTRVGAAYLTPPDFLAAIWRAPSEQTLVMGCFADGPLAAVGVFLQHGGTSAYFLNGWTDLGRQLSPNYLMLHAAFKSLIGRGTSRVDLGFSHSPALRSNKQRWGGTAATFRRITALGDVAAEQDAEPGYLIAPCERASESRAGV
jgi:hypothetical protein